MSTNTKNQPLVSVIIPVYNLKQYIEKCVTSIASQSYTDVEIIIIDDGSSDGSWEVIKRLSDKELRVTAIHQENKGVGAARNNGIKAASGEYILFVDADDYLPDEIISRMIENTKTNNPDLVVCGYQMVDDKQNVICEVLPGKYQQFKREEWVYRISSTCCRMYRKEFLQQNDILYIEEKRIRAEDIIFTLKANALAKNIVTVPVNGYYYYQRPDSAMHQYRGLRNYLLPYEALAELIEYFDNNDMVNSREFFDFGIIKFLAQCRYQLALGASRDNKRELIAFIRKYIGTSKKRYVSSWKYVKRCGIELPMTHRIAIELLLLQA